MINWKIFTIVCIAIPSSIIWLPIGAALLAGLVFGAVAGSAVVIPAALAKLLLEQASKAPKAPLRDCAGNAISEAQLRRIRQAHAGGWNR